MQPAAISAPAMCSKCGAVSVCAVWGVVFHGRRVVPTSISGASVGALLACGPYHVFASVLGRDPYLLDVYMFKYPEPLELSDQRRA